MTDIPGMTTDTDPDNPVHNYPAEVFPIGAALTVAYGSTERPFATLGNIYRLLGWLTGDIPTIDGDPKANPPLPSLADEIARCREYVLQQLPTELRVVDPPPAEQDNTADLAWVRGIGNKYGATIALRPMNGTNAHDNTDPIA